MNKMGENKIMKKYKGVVFFDYDGTTVDEVDEIKTATPTTVESQESRWDVIVRK